MYFWKLFLCFISYIFLYCLVCVRTTLRCLCQGCLVSVVISSVFGVCKDDTSLPVPGLSNVSRDLSRDHDPFFESREDHSLIGVANIFLEALFYDVQLQYHVPIISQQGEVTSVCLSVCLSVCV